ncbi:hypothetical protein [Dictyobacter formicarum]|uniref:hypothetical protein n=1 Tax=Dictyobacter formicarum TaxID=2778368 RepID=UPI001916B228|nr:hypothetical protein [Dictyobacter formicarum]
MLASRITIVFLLCCAMIGTLMVRPLQVHSSPDHMTGRVFMMKPVRIADFSAETIVVFISRSTNTCETTLVINSDGNVISDQCNRLLSRMTPSAVVIKLFSDVAAASPLSHLPQPQKCLKSSSFGTTTVLVSHGQVSPDVSCSQDQLGQTLYHDVYTILSAVSPAPPIAS